VGIVVVEYLPEYECEVENHVGQSLTEMQSMPVLLQMATRNSSPSPQLSEMELLQKRIEELKGKSSHLN
jgi:hypothetical protein